MAKLSQINRNKKREKMVAQYAAKRAALKATAEDLAVPPEERFEARLKLAKLPRNSSKTRIHHRCDVSGRPRGFYRKLRMASHSAPPICDPMPESLPEVGDSTHYCCDPLADTAMLHLFP